MRHRLPLFFFVFLFASIFLLYNHSMVRRLRDNNRESNETIAWFWAGTQIPMSILANRDRMAVCSQCGNYRLVTIAAEIDEIRANCTSCDTITTHYLIDRWSEEENELIYNQTRNLFSQLIDRLDYLTILTDNNNIPQVVNGRSVSDILSNEEMIKLKSLLETLDQVNDPIPIITVIGDTAGWLHYGQSDLEEELAFAPYIELGLLACLAIILFLGLRGEMKRQKGMAWVGFARETAHQLSTPLTSLMGWLEVLRERENLSYDTELLEAVDSMESDMFRLNQIARRYGEMGKKPKLILTSVNDIVMGTIDYFRSRPGLLGDRIKIEWNLNATSPVLSNDVLIGWVLENLIKNSIAAVGKKTKGLITITTRNLSEGQGGIEIQITDNGKGIPFSHQGKIFDAGFTTRTGGWGLGLTLTKRIVEEYHNGSIRLVLSSPEKGSTFVIFLPAYERRSEVENSTLG